MLKFKLDNITKCALFLLSLFLLSSCAKTTITPALESEASDATVQWLDEHYGIVSDSQVNEFVTQITKRLNRSVTNSQVAQQTGGDRRDQFNFPWQVFVLNVKEPNAFSTGAGVIFVTRGLVENADSESALASVISHEMAHQLLGHTREAIARAESDSNQSESPGFAFTLENEIDADTLGIKILANAQYDIRAATFALTMGYRPDSKTVAAGEPEWLTKRMSNLTEQIKAAGSIVPVTQSTRGFGKMREELAKLP